MKKKYCQQCGNQLDNINAKFCNKCGYRIRTINFKKEVDCILVKNKKMNILFLFSFVSLLFFVYIGIITECFTKRPWFLPYKNSSVVKNIANTEKIHFSTIPSYIFYPFKVCQTGDIECIALETEHNWCWSEDAETYTKQEKVNIKIPEDKKNYSKANIVALELYQRAYNKYSSDEDAYARFVYYNYKLQQAYYGSEIGKAKSIAVSNGKANVTVPTWLIKANESCKYLDSIQDKNSEWKYGRCMEENIWKAHDEESLWNFKTSLLPVSTIDIFQGCLNIEEPDVEVGSTVMECIVGSFKNANYNFGI